MSLKDDSSKVKTRSKKIESSTHRSSGVCNLFYDLIFNSSFIRFHLIFLSPYTPHEFGQKLRVRRKKFIFLVCYLSWCRALALNMALSEVFVEKAKKELGENQEKREECLKQFRKWLENHEFIKDCRDGE